MEGRMDGLMVRDLGHAGIEFECATELKPDTVMVIIFSMLWYNLLLQAAYFVQKRF